MDKIQKALNKLQPKERDIVKIVLQKLSNHNLAVLDIKKLKGRNDIFRIRKGKLRIIYRQDENNKIFLISIDRRSDNTYSL
jgi:mRNA-degrading endonuclease RelE of RelBE toxin-antitoxin system